MTPTDTSQTLVALEQQAVRLEALERSLKKGRAAMPTGDGVWRGPAHSGFVAGLHLLEREISGVMAELAAAVSATRRALHSVAHGG